MFAVKKENPILMVIPKTAEFQGLRYIPNVKARTVCAYLLKKSSEKLKIILKKFCGRFQAPPTPRLFYS